MPAPSLLARIPQNLPGVERLSPKNRAWAPLKLFFSLPRDLPSSAQGAWDSKSHLGSPETVGMGLWGISMCLGSVKGQGLAVSLEVWLGFSRAPGQWLNLGPGDGVTWGRGSHGGFYPTPGIHLSDSPFSDLLQTPLVLISRCVKPKSALGPALGQKNPSPASPLLLQPHGAFTILAQTPSETEGLLPSRVQVTHV